MAHLLQVPHRKLEDVCLLELGHVLALGLEGDSHNVLKLVQTCIDSGPPLSFQQRLGDLEEKKVDVANVDDA